MRNAQRQRCALIRIAPICLGSFLSANIAFAAIEDSHFGVSPDGTSIEFELRDVSRREVLDRLFAGQDIKLDWVNAAVANENISGNYGGSLSQVTRQLLGPLNFILVYDGVTPGSRLTRVVVVGRGSGVASPSLAVLEAEMQKAGRPVAPVPASTSKGSSAAAENPRPSQRPSQNQSQPPRTEARSALNQPPSGPVPTPLSISGAVPAPVPILANAPEPVPTISGTLPSVAPIAGANLPVLPAPASVPAK
jgi:hypothetical protein